MTMTVDDQPSTMTDGLDATAPGLTILWHPDVRRVGERLVFGERPVAVSRLAPSFRTATGVEGGSIGDPYVSRKPVIFARTRHGVRIEGNAEVDGVALTGPMRVDADQLERGVRITLARRVLLLLHQVPLKPRSGPHFGLVGDSVPMRRLRTDIGLVARSSATVLIRGESGAGKELVARAVHDASGRAGGPYQAVNVAAVPASVAASSFFGHTKGAFSGADRARGGYFGESDTGTLFLDEIGELPTELQPLLLRALETGDIQPVGAARARRVDVRIIAATDAALEAAVDEGRFSVPLMHRLAGLELWIPPLRQRLDDIPRLLIFALHKELAALDAEDCLTPDPNARRPWLEASTIELLLDHPWPGNVRELFNVARQIAVSGHTRPRVRVSKVAALARMREAQQAIASSNSVAEDPSRSAAPEPSSSDSTDTVMTVDGVLEALRGAGWSVHAAARSLNVPRTSLYRFIDAHQLIRKAAEIPDDELRAVYAECGGDRQAMSDRLRVSTRALTFRLKELDPPVGAG